LPGWVDVDLPPDESSQSSAIIEESQEGFSQRVTPIFGLAKAVKQAHAAETVPQAADEKPVKTPVKPMVPHSQDGIEYVEIKTTPLKRKSPLTAAQKEKIAEKSFVPQMYNELVSSQPRAIEESQESVGIENHPPAPEPFKTPNFALDCKCIILFLYIF
jgi:hypothetical protein